MGFNDNALSVDPLILSIDPRIKQASKRASDKIEAYEDNHLKAIELSYIQRLGGTVDKKEIELNKEPKIEEKIPNHIKTKNLVETSEDLQELAKNVGYSVSTIMNHLSLIKKDDASFDISKYMPNLSTINLVNKAIADIKEQNSEEDFSEDGNVRLKAIFTKLDEKVSYNDIKMTLV